MQLRLLSCDHKTIRATAPAQPNLNDKDTIFGGSSSALMTVCGWSLISLNLQQRHHRNDVVIAQAQTRWHKAQKDDLIINAHGDINWPSVIASLADKQQPKIKLVCHVGGHQYRECAVMEADFVILNR